MADLASIQRTLQREIKKTTRTKPLFLETRGSVWSSTKLPIACFSLYAVVIYALNNAGLGEGGASVLSSFTQADNVLYSSPQLWQRCFQLECCPEHDRRPDAIVQIKQQFCKT